MGKMGPGKRQLLLLWCSSREGGVLALVETGISGEDVVGIKLESRPVPLKEFPVTPLHPFLPNLGAEPRKGTHEKELASGWERPGRSKSCRGERQAGRKGGRTGVLPAPRGLLMP